MDNFPWTSRGSEKLKLTSKPIIRVPPVHLCVKYMTKSCLQGMLHVTLDYKNLLSKWKTTLMVKEEDKKQDRRLGMWRHFSEPGFAPETSARASIFSRAIKETEYKIKMARAQKWVGPTADALNFGVGVGLACITAYDLAGSYAKVMKQWNAGVQGTTSASITVINEFDGLITKFDSQLDKSENPVSIEDLPPQLRRGETAQIEVSANANSLRGQVSFHVLTNTGQLIPLVFAWQNTFRQNALFQLTQTSSFSNSNYPSAPMKAGWYYFQFGNYLVVSIFFNYGMQASITISNGLAALRLDNNPFHIHLRTAQTPCLFDSTPIEAKQRVLWAGVLSQTLNPAEIKNAVFWFYAIDANYDEERYEISYVIRNGITVYLHTRPNL